MAWLRGVEWDTAWARWMMYAIRGFSSTARGYKFGTLLLETTHQTEGSKDVEVSAWRERMKRGEVAYIEVTRLTSPYGMERITA